MLRSTFRIVAGAMLAAMLLAPSLASAQTTSTTGSTTTSTTSTMFTTFSDVNAQTPDAGAIQALTALGLVDGMTPTTFDPSGNLTRAQFAKLVDIAVGFGSAAKLLSAQSTVFKDVPAGKWYTGYIAIAYAKQLIKGEGSGVFAPDADVTYAQALTILVRALGYAAAVPAKSYPTGDVEEAASLGLINGVSVSNVSAPIDRAEAAGLLWNALRTRVGVVSGTGSTATVTPSGQTLLHQALGDSLVYAGATFSQTPTSDANVVTAVGTNRITVNGQTLDFASGAKVLGVQSLSALLGQQVSYATDREGQLLLVKDVTPSSHVLTGTVSAASASGFTLTPASGAAQNLTWAASTTASSTSSSGGQGTPVRVNGQVTYVSFTPMVLVNGQPLNLDSASQLDGSTVQVVTDGSGSVVSLTAQGTSGSTGVITAVGTSGYSTTLTLDDTTTLTLDPSATVTLNGQPATASSLAVGDVVTVARDYNSQNQALDTVHAVSATSTGITGTLSSVSLGAQGSVTVNGVKYGLSSSAMVDNGGQFSTLSSGINGVVGFPVTVILGPDHNVALIKLSQASLNEGLVVSTTGYGGELTIFSLGGHTHTFAIAPGSNVSVPSPNTFVEVHLNQSQQVVSLQTAAPQGASPTPVDLTNITPQSNGTFTADVSGGSQETFVLALDAPVVLATSSGDSTSSLAQIGQNASGMAYVSSTQSAQVDLLVVTSATQTTQNQEVLLTRLSATLQNGATVDTITGIEPGGTTVSLTTTDSAFVPSTPSVATVEASGTTLSAAPSYQTPSAYATSASSSTAGSFTQNGTTYYGVPFVPTGTSSFTAGGKTYYVSPDTVFFSVASGQTVSFSSLSTADAVVVWATGSPAVAQFVVVTH